MEASAITHRPDCDPRERTRSSCPCGVLDAYIAEACARLEAMLAARRDEDAVAHEALEQAEAARDAEIGLDR